MSSALYSYGSDTSLYLSVVLGILCVCLATGFLTPRYGAPLPPGPKGIPVLGNILDMPGEQAWKVFAKWGQTWGDIVHVHILGQPMIIVNSLDVANDMLDRKSHIYSDRPHLIMGGELAGWNKILAMTPYGERFRKYRKLFHRLMGSRASVQHLLPSAEREAALFLKRLAMDPENLGLQIRKTATAFILRVSHGCELEEQGDGIVPIVEKATSQLSKSLVPGAFLVDVLPFLRHVPAWFPLAGFKRTAMVWRNSLNNMVDTPHAFVKQQMAAGSNIPSFSSDALELQFEESIVKWASASLYSGGSDTSVSTIHAFFLAMTMHPEIQKKAQAEIDEVVGVNRLPTFEDRPRLPYVDALVKEVFRSFPATPLGAPHRVIKDDVQNGYYIPKGSTIIANVWGMLHDPKRYPGPMLFDPQRFLSSEKKQPDEDPYNICFGFGRRSCPGQLLADYIVYISVVASLAVFDISKAQENGVEIQPKYEISEGVISHPMPFRYSIRPRSARAEALLMSIDE